MRKTVPLLLFLVSLPLAAQTPYLVKDLNPVSTTSPASSTPHGFTRFGARVYFAATDNHSLTPGTELWATGTAAGTTAIKDINGGLDSSNPSRFIVVNGKLLFNAQTTSFVPGQDLWSTDGTNVGTTFVGNFEGKTSFSPGDRVAYHDKMLFSAGDNAHGRELWITDGTNAGTRLLKDLVPGANGSDPRSFVVFNDLVYFGTASGGFWKSDGTEAGTVVVSPSIVVSEALVAGPRMFLVAYTDQTGIEPWVSDGTDAGTHLIAETAPGGGNSIAGLTLFGDRILFTGLDAQHGGELWITDGTAAGTHLVREINPGPDGSVSASSSIAVAGNVAYFAATTVSEGRELWKTDGTEAGTAIVRDILPGSEGSAPEGMVAVGAQVFFVASNGTDRTLWVTDGTDTGTKQVKTSQRLAVGTSFLGGAVLTNIDGVLYFAGANSQNGYEPWKSDGTDAGTSMLENIAIDSEPSSDPSTLTAIGNSLFFGAWDGTGTVTNNTFALTRWLWRTDGTSGGTVKLTDGPSSPKFTLAGNSFFFSKSDGSLWTSDGTPEGTVAATEFAKRFPINSVFFISFVMGDKIFASVTPGLSSTTVLWVTTTAPGAPAVSLGIPGNGFSEVAGRAMFFSNGGLWTSDGTVDGTYAVVPDLVQPALIGQAVMGGRLYFIKKTTDGTALWRSDGTFEGTTEVKSFTDTISTLTTAGQNVFFIVGTQLWVTDGTPSGTHSLPATPGGTMTAAGDRVIFVAGVFATGQEPWVSDGTAEGTHLLLDIRTGEPNSGPTEMTSIAGLAYFAAFDALHGNEPWVTDGTAEGTRLVADVETATSPGNFLSPGSSSPKLFTRAGERVYFTAATLAAGNELWAVPLPSTPRLTINDLRLAEGDAGTKTARFTVTMSPPSAQTITVDYATSDDTATGGSDYDSVSGTLTFAAGETSKSIDVNVRGDVTPENNEVFFVTLRNPAGARLEKSAGFAIIDDDDQTADLSLSLDFSLFPETLDVLANATNGGPRAATNISIAATQTPGEAFTLGCFRCAPKLSQLASGATARARVMNALGSGQQYLSATAKEHQRDPQPSNNSVGWTINGAIVMDALYLNPGSKGNVWFSVSTSLAGTSLTVESSSPSVLSVPAAVTVQASGLATFVASGLSPGTSTIRISRAGTLFYTLAVDVLPLGTKPRWPAGIQLSQNIGDRFDQPVVYTINSVGTVPFTGETATGTVTLTSKGHELGRVTLIPGVRQQAPLTYYPEEVGSNPITIAYGGDTNFLPMTLNLNVISNTGFVTMMAGAARAGTTATVHIRVTGSPSAAPTGTITVSEPGVIPATPASLSTTSPGVAEAEVKLINLSAGQHTLTLAYSGDTRYEKGSQSLRMVEARVRGVKH